MTNTRPLRSDSRPRNIAYFVNERQNRTLRAWLLTVLRFAVTLDEADKAVALAAATELDKAGSQTAVNQEFRFFRRTCNQVCIAIGNPGVQTNFAILREHIARIGDDRIRRAFSAVLELETKKETRSSRRANNIWKGLN